MDVDEFVERYPRLFHRAQEGSWPLIRRDGLLSPSALLDRYRVEPERRYQLESCKRTRSVRIEHPDSSETAVLRDNVPISEQALRKLLVGNTEPRDWYRELNGRVFFWVAEKSLRGFLHSYRQSAHDVITLDTRRLVERDYDRVAITPMNTGSARFADSEMRRGPDVFSAIDQFPLEAWDLLTSPGRDTIVELAVGYELRDVEELAVCVQRRRGRYEVLTTLWEQQAA